jgi:AmmeMemoRadiSam system protein A
MFQLSESNKTYLLELSRKTIQEFLQSGGKPSGVPAQAELLEKRGVFVTLHRGGHLRGCIGYIVPLFPLYEAVINCSISAATDDPRFQPLSPEELDAIEIEISVLSSAEIVQDIRQIEIGVHGLMINRKGARGLLLPQVALEHGWDREKFLSETCRKAHLQLDAWKKGAVIESFTAIIFREADFDLRKDHPSVAKGGR